MGFLLKYIHETNNGEDVDKLRLDAIFFDMLHNFSRCKKPHGIYIRGADVFTQELKKQPFVSNVTSQPYKMQNPQTQVLWHGIIYNALFNLYMKHISTGFNDYFLSNEKTKYDANKEIITTNEYKKLPKRYHAIFVPYNSKHYVLNVPHSNLIFLYNDKKNRDKLELLLRKAQKYIPVIYNEPTPDMDLGGMQVTDMPLHVPDSAASQLVSDEQITAIQKLHNIFIAISKFTFPSLVLSTPNKNLIDEYLHDKNQQNAVLIAAKSKKEIYKKLKREKYLQSKNTPKQPARIALKKLKRTLKQPQQYQRTVQTPDEQYKEINNVIMNNLKRQITNTY